VEHVLRHENGLLKVGYQRPIRTYTGGVSGLYYLIAQRVLEDDEARALPAPRSQYCYSVLIRCSAESDYGLPCGPWESKACLTTG
jgi:hypothetical protein